MGAAHESAAAAASAAGVPYVTAGAAPRLHTSRLAERFGVLLDVFTGQMLGTASA